MKLAIAGGITSVDSRSDKGTQSGTLCSTPQWFFFFFLFFFEVFGSLEPALTNFMYANLLLETWYDVKKFFTDETRTRNTVS